MKLRTGIIALIATLFLTTEAKSQSQTSQEYYYLLLFKDKMLNYVRLDEPETFLSAKSLERRQKHNIAVDTFDLPVTKAYVDNVAKRDVKVMYTTKWLNGVVVSTKVPDSARILLRSWYIKKAVYLGKSEDRWFDKPSGHSEPEGPLELADDTNDNETYGKAYDQIKMIGGLPLHQQGHRGQGISIAVFDEGFYKVDRLKVFQHLHLNQQIKGTFDIVSGDDDVYQDGDHGMKVLSCVAGSQRGKMTGTAPDADYYLFRTEDNSSEYLIEEINWIKAAEIADSIGVDIINSSLGYTTFDDKGMNHSWADLDGKTTYITRGANLASSRGILVVNSAGNDGNKSWKYIDPPGDSKAILTVGAIDMDGELADFSSVNYSKTGFTKPDIVAPGKRVYVANSYGSVSTGNGTSYACPITTGMCACLLQLNPTAKPLEVIRAVQKSGDRSFYPDDQYGYGVPNFNLANTFLGGNKDFDYSKVQFVPIEERFQSNAFEVDVYNMDYEELEFWVTVKKRFIFFTYYKKLGKSTFLTDESFTRVQAFVPQKYLGKEIKLKAVVIGANGKKTFYSPTFIINSNQG